MQGRPPSDLGTYAKLVATSVAWGGSVVAIKYAVASVPPFTLSFLRYTVAGVIFAAILVARGGRPLGWRASILLILAGFLGIVVWSGAVSTSVIHTGAGESALVTSLSPFVAAVLAYVLLRDPFTFRKVAGAAISFAGIALLLFAGPDSTITAPDRLLGDLIALLAALGWGTYSVVVGLALRKGALPIETTAYSTIAGAIIFVPLALFEPARPSFEQIPLGAWFAIAYLAVVSTVGAYLWWNEGVRRIGAARASLFSHLANVNSVIFSAVLFEERLAALQVAGAVCVISGLVLANRPTAVCRQ